jgi:hypothetical protein
MFLLSKAEAALTLKLPLRLLSPFSLPGYLLALVDVSDKQSNIYNILWAVVFGFATINILSLVAKRMEPSRSRLNFGETLAIMVVVVSVILLGWEMLYFFHILPIKVEPQ